MGHATLTPAQERSAFRLTMLQFLQAVGPDAHEYLRVRQSEGRRCLEAGFPDFEQVIGRRRAQLLCRSMQGRKMVPSLPVLQLCAASHTGSCLQDKVTALV